MIWFLLGLIVVAVLVNAVSHRLGRPNEHSYSAMIELHAVRRQMEVAQLKHQIRSSAAKARRELRDELDGLDHESEGP